MCDETRRRNVSISPFDDATKIAAPNDSILSLSMLHTNLDEEAALSFLFGDEGGVVVFLKSSIS